MEHYFVHLLLCYVHLQIISSTFWTIPCTNLCTCVPSGLRDNKIEWANCTKRFVSLHGSKMSGEEQSDLAPVMTLFGTPSLVVKHRADLQIYVEACKAYSILGSARFLVTDDHKFYKLS